MKNLKSKLFYISSAITYILLILFFAVVSIMFLEEKATNILISTFASNMQQSDNIVEIVIDDFSVQKYKWPWSKDKLADILDYFRSYSYPSVIGLDIDISYNKELQSTDMRFINVLKSMKNVVVGFSPEMSDDDKAILNEFQKRYALNLESKLDIPISPYNGVKISDMDYKNPTPNYGSVIVDSNYSAATVLNYGNIVKIKDSYYPSLAFKMYLIANDTNDVFVDDKYINVPKTGLNYPYAYYKNGVIKSFIRYYKPLYSNGKETSYSHLNVSASRILDTYYALKSGITPKTHPEMYVPERNLYINPQLFNKMVVLIGGNISGPSADVLRTPMNVRHPGVDIQATVYDNIQNGVSLKFSDLEIEFLIFAFLCFTSFLAVIKMKFFKGLFSLIFLDFMYLIMVCYFAYHGLIMCYATPITCQIVTIVFAYTFKFMAENRNKEKIKSAMGKYLSKDIMQNIVKNIDDLKLGGKKAVVTVLFSDIRGFTSLSEKMSAEEVSSILNEYFGEMEPIITKYNGVINKFIGDAIMAIFGEPIQDDNHPQNAVKCAYEMLQRVKFLREKWLSEGKPKIEIGIGINTGEVFIGNIGTETRMEYTVIGDTVNLASRIESYNKVYKTKLLVSSSTYPYVANISDVIKISDVQIRGKSKKTDIYEILRIF